MRVPSDWAIVRADELGQVVAGGTPSTEVDEYWGGDIAWVTPAVPHADAVGATQDENEVTWNAALHTG